MTATGECGIEVKEAETVSLKLFDSWNYVHV